MAETIEEPFNSYEKLYGKKLSSDEVAEMKGNLTGFLIELILADRENRSEGRTND